MKKLTTLDRIHISLFAALTAVGAFIKVPFYPVPFTLQFLFCAYAGMLLGARKGLYSQLLYVGIGLIGVPVFANGGGLSYVFQPTFGFLIGFIMAAFVMGLFIGKNPKANLLKKYMIVIIGLGIVYLCGVPYLYYMYNYISEPNISWMNAIEWGFIPYFIPDMLLSLMVVLTSEQILPILHRERKIESKVI